MCDVLSRILPFATPWTVACEVPLSIGILQARILEWVSMPSSRGSSQPRDRTLETRGQTRGHLMQLLHCRQILYHGATWEALKFMCVV